MPMFKLSHRKKCSPHHYHVSVDKLDTSTLPSPNPSPCPSSSAKAVLQTVNCQQHHLLLTPTNQRHHLPLPPIHSRQPWTKPKTSSKCPASSSRTAGASSRAAASVRLPTMMLCHLLRGSANRVRFYSRSPRIPPHQPSRRYGLPHHGRDRIHCQAEYASTNPSCARGEERD